MPKLGCRRAVLAPGYWELQCWMLTTHLDAFFKLWQHQK